MTGNKNDSEAGSTQENEKSLFVRQWRKNQESPTETNTDIHQGGVLSKAMEKMLKSQKLILKAITS